MSDQEPPVDGRPEDDRPAGERPGDGPPGDGRSAGGRPGDEQSSDVDQSDDRSDDGGPADAPTGDRSPDRLVDAGPMAPLSLDEALAVLGEETRVRILLELGTARSHDRPTPEPLGFSALMERVGVEDSGLFNYHLDRLVGTFVRKDEAGYRLTLPGQLVFQAVVAGTLTERRTVEPFPVGECPDCDGVLTAAYLPTHLLTVECGDCETLFDATHFPARGLDGRSTTALLDAAYQRRHHEVATMRRGVCPGCGGRVDCDLRPEIEAGHGSDAGSGPDADSGPGGGVGPDSDPGSDSDADSDSAPGSGGGCLETFAVLSCAACRASLVGHPANVALTTPAVVGFLADRGRDAALVRWWDEPVAGARDGIEVVREGPTAVAIPFEVDGERLRVVLDDDLRVVEAERTGP